ncbi:GumC domain-containing protein [Mycolicibacterium llatzerense]|uniref:hypothetical protein n=1 Tax=Mycolicibacterium llatzerense TaxID=280871 RepID=UPI0021B52ED3|nr:hypothetical protein [Mycolicibacterium llatzerense]
MQQRRRTAISRWITPLWPITLVGIALGALIGAFAFAPSKDVTASTVIRVDEPIEANQIMLGTQPLLNTMPDYMSGELAYLSSPSYLDSVAKKLAKGTKPQVSASQAGKSNLVTLSATAANPDDARHVVDTAVTAFTGHIFDQNQQRYQASLDAVNAVIPKLEEAQRASEPNAGRPTDELVQLYFRRTSLEVELLRAPGIQTVEPTRITTSTGLLSSSAIGPIGGGLIGGIIALAGAMVWRTRSRTVTSVAQLDGEDRFALRPVLRLGEQVDEVAARAVYAQLPLPRTGNILVVGASADSGSTAVARHIAFAAGEHGEVATADLINGDSDASSAETAILDGHTWSTPVAVETADNADHIIVVVRIGFDTADDVDIAARAIAHRDAPVSIVATRA